MPQQKPKFGNPLEAAAQTGLIGGGDEEDTAKRPAVQPARSPDLLPAGPPAIQPAAVPDFQNSRPPEFQPAQDVLSAQAAAILTQTSRIPDRQQFRPPAPQTASPPLVQHSKGKKLPKLNADGWEQQTIYLPPDLRQWLRLYAVATNQEMSSITAEALQEYRMKQQRGGT